jgi:hypothetical protein
LCYGDQVIGSDSFIFTEAAAALFYFIFFTEGSGSFIIAYTEAAAAL